MKPVIFTDLDGTLLHPRDYSVKGAEAALERILAEGIPLVFCSSKSRAEIEVIRATLSNTHPFISENGGGVFVPREYFPFPSGGRKENGYEAFSFGVDYEKTRRALASAGSKVNGRVRGFGDMTDAEVAALAGLSEKEARLARTRDFDEPFVFDGSPQELEKLLAAITEAGFTWTRGRFFHILGSHDKGKAVRLVKGLYERLYGTIASIGLGNGENDLPMLEEADYPVLVMDTGGGYVKADVEGLILADGVGPLGWGRAVAGILDDIRDSAGGAAF